MKRAAITLAEFEAAKEAEKKTQNKRIARKAKIIQLRYAGMGNDEIGKIVGLSGRQVSRLVTEFKKIGNKEYFNLRYGGNHRLLSEKQEDEILAGFEKEAAAGRLVTVAEIKTEYDKAVGKDTGSANIYNLLKRHNWRKTMPRSKHPKKASDEKIADSKKLTNM